MQIVFQKGEQEGDMKNPNRTLMKPSQCCGLAAVVIAVLKGLEQDGTLFL